MVSGTMVPGTAEKIQTHSEIIENVVKENILLKQHLAKKDEELGATISEMQQTIEWLVAGTLPLDGTGRRIIVSETDPRPKLETFEI